MSLLHIPIDSTEGAVFALLPGDPARVDGIGQRLESFRILGQNREFRCGKGFTGGIPVLVCSTGIGCPSTAIAAEELISIGVKYFIRVGTCGGAWRPDILCGTVVIPSACVRDEGTTSEYIPLGFPAVANFELLRVLNDAALVQSIPFLVGINRTHDAFYGPLAAVTKWGQCLNDEQWKGSDTSILSSDMECAALFVVCSLRGANAGAVLAVNAPPEPLRQRLNGKLQVVAQSCRNACAQQSIDNAIAVALHAIPSAARSGSLPS